MTTPGWSEQILRTRRHFLSSHSLKVVRALCLLERSSCEWEGGRQGRWLDWTAVWKVVPPLPPSSLDNSGQASLACHASTLLCTAWNVGNIELGPWCNTWDWQHWEIQIRCNAMNHRKHYGVEILSLTQFLSLATINCQISAVSIIL